MLPNLMDFVKRNQSDIFVIIVIVLTALLGFGFGRLTATKPDSQPIIIQNPENSSASIQSAVLEEEKTTEQLIGSVNGTKYHLPSCPSAKKIAPQNQIWFSSEEEAQSKGYTPCGICGKK